MLNPLAFGQAILKNDCAPVWLLFSTALSSQCHSDDADSAVVMTFPHCHANIPRSLWPAVSLSPIISTTVWPPCCLLSRTSSDTNASPESCGVLQTTQTKSKSSNKAVNCVCLNQSKKLPKQYYVLMFTCIQSKWVNPPESCINHPIDLHLWSSCYDMSKYPPWERSIVFWCYCIMVMLTWPFCSDNNVLA